MRRIVKHAMAGVGAGALAMAAAVSTLSASSSADVRPAPVTADVLPSAAPHVDASGAGAVAAGRDLRSDRETREAQRGSIAAAASRAAGQRASTLSAQRQQLVKQREAIRVAQAKAEMKAARAKAALARAQAERSARAATAQAKAKATATATATAKARAKAKARAAAESRSTAAEKRGYRAGEGDPRVIARQILKNKYAYGADQYACFNYIIVRESNWSVNATNASSGAYGIPQALPGSKMASVGVDWRTNPATQIVWGIDYMKNRYGSPCAAKAFKASHGWY